MTYLNITKAVFLQRPNRFVAKVLLDGKEEIVHVKNTGRCKELLVTGVNVFLTECIGVNRKTRFDLIAVEKLLPGGKTLLINIDSSAPNAVVGEFLPVSGLFRKGAKIKAEAKFASSRFDFYVEDGSRRAFLEVKGVTLESDGKVLFPDAPTLRGVKHLVELIRATEKGYEAYLIFVIQMKGASSFSPNEKTHPEFAAALRRAAESGVKILAYDCLVTPDSLQIDCPVAVKL